MKTRAEIFFVIVRIKKFSQKALRVRTRREKLLFRIKEFLDREKVDVKIFVARPKKNNIKPLFSSRLHNNSLLIFDEPVYELHRGWQVN
jgi:hypothetical protein